MRRYIAILSLLLASGMLASVYSAPQSAPESAPKTKLPHDYPIQPLSATLQDKFWAPRQAEDVTMHLPQAIARMEKNGEVRNFDRAAGKLDGVYEGNRTNDSDIYKLLEACARYTKVTQAMGAAGNPEARAFRDTLITSITALVSHVGPAQQADGYIMTSHMVPSGPGFRPPGDHTHFLGEQSSHELYAAGHMEEAAALIYQNTGDRALLDIAEKNVDLLINTFAPGKMMLPPGHEEIEVGLSRMYRATGDKKYLDLAKFYIDQRGNAEGHKLYGSYNQDTKPVAELDAAEGHSVRALYLYAGMAEVSALTGDKSYLPALDKIWNDVHGSKMYITGGLGSVGRIEGFGEPYSLPNTTAYAETCAAIANVFWNQKMFQLSGDAKYLDIVEREIFNGIPVGRKEGEALYYYQTPMERTRQYNRVPWFGTPCCPTNTMRFDSQVSDLLYSQKGNELFVNQYLASSVTVPLEAGPAVLRQTTDYPWDGHIKLTVSQLAKPANFTLSLRLPGWAEERPVPSDLYTFAVADKEPITLKVNGKAVDKKADHGFVKIARTWSSNDTVELDLPMPARRVVANAKVEADAGKVAIQRGPVLYCVDGADNNKTLATTFALDDSAKLSMSKGKIGANEVPFIETTARAATPGAAPAKLVLRPLYGCFYGDSGSMAVWVNR